MVFRVSAVLLLTALAAPAPAQDVPVTFRVRMAYQIELGQFDPAVDFVDLAGTFNGWGTDPLTPLSDADGDTIYDVTLDGFTPGEEIEFKFRLNGVWDGSEEFPGGGPNRRYTVREQDNEILVWYDDEQPAWADLAELSWWNDTVFYEVFVRSFHDSDGDGIGDLPGLTSKLDYLNDGDPATDTDLGVTGIWLMPINDSPSYHGYDATDYRAINPDYGTMADFQAFLAAAHARGIRVIVDYVMNHCSTQHPWFQASAQAVPAYADWFVWRPDDPGWTQPWGGGPVWHWNPTRQLYYYGLFWGGMPDLNYETPAVKTEMFDTAAWWLETVGVDGFRLDAVLYVLEDGAQLQNTEATFQFWQDFNQHVKAVKPDVLSVGEAWTNSSTVVQYVTDDRLDLCFEFDLAGAILGAANGGDAQWLASKARSTYGLYPYLQWATFLTNHDQSRVMTVLGEDADKAKVAAGIALTLPGVPFLYYGEEIGMVGDWPHEDIRRPMQWTAGPHAGFTTGTPWIAVDPGYPEWNVAVEEQDPGSLLNRYKRLIGVRNSTPALRRGEYLPLDSSAAPVLAFLRRYEDQLLLVVANTGQETVQGLALGSTQLALPPGDYPLVDLLDPADTRTVAVDDAHVITGLDVAGLDVAVYEFDGPSDVDADQAPPPTRLQLAPNHPNPFNPATTVRYALPDRAHVRLRVFDLAGREVVVLRDGVQPAGAHAARWDGRDRGGRRVSAGTYVLRLEAGGESRSIKMTLVK